MSVCRAELGSPACIGSKHRCKYKVRHIGVHVCRYCLYRWPTKSLVLSRDGGIVRWE